MRLLLGAVVVAFFVGVIVGRVSGPEPAPPLVPPERKGPVVPRPSAVRAEGTEPPAEALVERVNAVAAKPPSRVDRVPEIYVGSLIRTPNGDLKILGAGDNYRLARHGRWLTPYPSGAKLAEEMYVDGLLEGAATYWHESGAVKEQGSNAAGKRKGLWESFDEAGNRIGETEYDAGMIENIRQWDRDGTLLTDDSREERATCGGKYRGLLHRFHAPDDVSQVGEFKDHGHYHRFQDKGGKDIPAAYWVYVNPYWYLWRETTE